MQGLKSVYTLNTYNLLIFVAGVECAVGYAGQYFVLAFPENGGQGTLTLYVSSASGVTATVQISAPLSTGVWAGQQFNVAPGSSQAITVPIQLQLSGNNIESKGILISASSNVVVFARNQFNAYCGAFQVFPQTFLGTSYYTVSTWASPKTLKSYTNIAVVASRAGTTSVTFTFPQDRGISINYGGTRYTSSLTVQLNQYQSVQIQDTGNADLTGTLVASSQPVAVFSGDVVGNVIDDFAENPVTDHLVEQMIPTSTYGTLFYAASFPGQFTQQIYIRVICRDQGTVVYVNNQAIQSCNPGNTVDYVGQQWFIAVQSNNPVLVAQIHEGQQSASYGSPSLVLVPPVANYLSQYTFIVPAEINSATLLITVPNSAQNNILLNGATLNAAWTSFSTAPTTYGAQYILAAGVYTIQHSSNMPFGAYVYGRDSVNQCAVAYNVGMRVGTSNCVRFLFT